MDPSALPSRRAEYRVRPSGTDQSNGCDREFRRFLDRRNQFLSLGGSDENQIPGESSLLLFGDVSLDIAPRDAHRHSVREEDSHLAAFLLNEILNAGRKTRGLMSDNFSDAGFDLSGAHGCRG